MKRTFIAIKIPLAKQKQEILFDIQRELQDEKIKWVDNWNMHVTLLFLGNTKTDLIPDISEKIMDSIKDIKSFKLQLKGIRIFKSLRDPKVIWIGMQESNSLKRLKERIDIALIPFGFQKDKRRYNPHLTLGRIKFIKNKENLKKVLDNYMNQDFGEIDMNEVIFYESTLTPKGPIYKVIKQFELA